MNPVKVYSISLGCPKNRVDTERMLACFTPSFVPAETPREADVVLINTCGFIAPAVKESVETILDIADEIADLSPRPILAVAGCLVSRYRDELIPEIPEVDLWLKTLETDRWPQAIAKALGREPFEPEPFVRALSTGPSFAYLKVSEGCNHACSFCTIPSLRGKLASRSLDVIEREAKELVAAGVPELVMVAQDLTAYGMDRGEKDGLIPLMERLLRIDGLHWLRPMYLYPGGLSDTLLDFMKDAGRPFVPYFDIPLQHAHPDILKSMGRPFARDPRIAINKVRDRFPDAALRTSIIVGYPGETDEHFDELVNFIREARFTHLGVFGFCDEEGTRAHELDGKVEAHVIEERRAALMEVQRDISAEILSGFEGDEMDVLVDRPHEEWETLHVGRTWFQAPEVDGATYVSGPDVAPGRVVRATIEETQDYDLVALA